MSEAKGKDNKKQAIKDLIKELHAGARPEEVKEKFKEALGGIGAADISRIEGELIEEGMPAEEIRRLCDVHLAVFRDSLQGAIKTLASPGHPIHTLMEEHKILLQFADKLKSVAEKMKGAEAFAAAGENIKKLSDITEHFKESEKHYVREENVLFPYLEKHGITHPPAIMWAEHNDIREEKKKLYKLVEDKESMSFEEFAKKLGELAENTGDMLSSHFYKESNILFPAALKVIAEDEWRDIRKQCDELGYCCFTPEYAKGVVRAAGEPTSQITSSSNEIAFETGEFSTEELEALLNTLPVDITFVDKEDRVRYFSQSKERIFPRTKAVIGRKVQQCHPQRSLHVVEEILNDFKENKREEAGFWINMGGRLIYIRYFAVRDKAEKYLGCLEVTQDITDIKKIEGEKRLL
jgi:PAS domain S-box-containing protein